MNCTEEKVLNLIRMGKTNKEIAEQLNYSESHIKKINSRIYDKLGARNRVEAMIFSEMDTKVTQMF